MKKRTSGSRKKSVSSKKERYEYDADLYNYYVYTAQNAPGLGAITPTKRTVSKSGQPYYFQGGKRVSASKGAKDYIRQEYENIKSSPELIEQLTKREKKSFQAKESGLKNAQKFAQSAKGRFRFGGRFIKQCLQDIFEATILDLVGKDEKELKKVFPQVRDYGDLLRLAQQSQFPINIAATEWGLPNTKRRRITSENIVDIATRYDSENALMRLTLVVITPEGKQIEGRIPALEAIRDWEIDRVDELERMGGNPAYVRFRHQGLIDVESCSFIIDLRETTEDIQYSP